MRILKWHEIMMNPVEREFISWAVLHVQFRKPVIMCLFWIFPLENGQEAAGSVPQGISDLWLNAGHTDVRDEGEITANDCKAEFTILWKCFLCRAVALPNQTDPVCTCGWLLDTYCQWSITVMSQICVLETFDDIARSLESAFTRPRETHCCWLTVIHIHKKYVTDTQVITEILW